MYEHKYHSQSLDQDLIILYYFTINYSITTTTVEINLNFSQLNNFDYNLYSCNLRIKNPLVFFFLGSELQPRYAHQVFGRDPLRQD